MGEEPNFYIEDVLFLQDEQNVEISVAINSNKDEDTGVYVSIALYDGDKVIALNVTNTIIYKDIPHRISLSEQIKNINDSDIYARVFLWSADNMMLPLMSSHYIKS